MIQGFWIPADDGVEHFYPERDEEDLAILVPLCKNEGASLSGFSGRCSKCQRILDAIAKVAPGISHKEQTAGEVKRVAEAFAKYRKRRY